VLGLLGLAPLDGSSALAAAAWLLVNSKTGISATQLHREM